MSLRHSVTDVQNGGSREKRKAGLLTKQTIDKSFVTRMCEKSAHGNFYSFNGHHTKTFAVELCCKSKIDSYF